MRAILVGGIVRLISDWLTAAPYRAVVLNIAMLVLLLALVDSATLFALVGVSCLAVAGLVGLRGALRASFRRAAGARAAFDRVLVWLPGAAALTLGAVGLHLAVTAPAGSTMHLAGIVLFGFELVMLALPADETPAPAKAA
ncbi:hypothetical protein [Reyranella sp.]|uniref:hypothetical protein n=1 Tax=Reyranella sp. TaxID=1929291 RepID=UPI000BD94F04|nr:hypothetical protein [Reyranella sp.]OYY43133.1 MAG: hypothetical protein B7Y57_10240 [Rhodospirillales bacterium 35-66-84]OYZ95103.1 MAG: hypothetical protein B7Y08_10050 [Rhodospirillales bacterium 24-66-33]OZB26543.1 MAG: hypothetical protein B7X63_08405 [Rhodospirillales bacterium 39-66-50]HQS15960.1 hypothetical protein [Reyranella sp.]HQT13226.1 hypothetical protein [Reyranella sp.]